MTVRPNNTLPTSDASISTNEVPTDKPLENLSPPKKRLRLSLKGQQFLGSLSNYQKDFQKHTLLTPKMQNIRPNLLDPMSMHVSYTGSGMGLMAPSYNRMETNGEIEIIDREKPIRLDSSSNEKSSTLPPVATLLNLGNTCFLNSVLYTLRFTPGFAHLLHHLAADLTEKKLLSTSGSTERKIGFLSSGSPGLRTKSLSSLTPNNLDEGNVQIDAVKRKILVLTERLHELLQTLHNAEQKGDLGEPFQADAFLQALREVNPLFQGNQQQDAHELLVCSLDYLREACQLVDKAQTKSNEDNSEAGVAVDQTSIETPNTTNRRGKQISDKKKKGKKLLVDKEKELKKGKRPPSNNYSSTVTPSPIFDQDNIPAVVEETIKARKMESRDFISESFEGITVLRTTCLECEFVTERREPFMHICVPIANESGEETFISPSAFFASTLMEVDFLRDTNKYWCEQCVRYNEARRSVHYEKLPRLLVLQLKRFSFSFGSTVHTSKVNDFMPTPMQLDCFCERCQSMPDSPIHSYKLYAIIMHLGATMASGHYVAYTRVCSSISDYINCSRNKLVPSSPNPSRTNSERNSGSATGGGILRFFKPKSSSTLHTESVSSFGLPSPQSLCKSVNCCSARPRKLFPEPIDKEKLDKDTPGNESPSSSFGFSTNSSDDIWLECDDEVIRVLKMRELEDLLSRKPRTSALTPYLLFYVQGATTVGASVSK